MSEKYKNNTSPFSLCSMVLQQSIKLIQGNYNIDPSEAQISWLCHDSSIFTWGALAL
jgi:hypothetical protein